MKLKARSTVSAEALCAKFNKTFPVGTPVRYWTGRREGRGKESVTRSAAQVVSGVAVVWVGHEPGCIALTHIEPLPPEAPHATP